MSIHRAAVVPIIVSLMLCGCQSLRAYDGPRQLPERLAFIEGDTRVAGAPVAVILRQVDGFDLGWQHSGAQVLPGAHTLLIDCTVTESRHTSRHHLDVDVSAGGKYRLVAQTGQANRECIDVQMIGVN